MLKLTASPKEAKMNITNGEPEIKAADSELAATQSLNIPIPVISRFASLIHNIEEATLPRDEEKGELIRIY